MLRRLLLIALAGIINTVGVSTCRADFSSLDSISPQGFHNQLVNQELDKVESAQHQQEAAIQGPVASVEPVASVVPVGTVAPVVKAVPKGNGLEFSSENYWAKYDEPGNFSQKGFMSGYNASYTHRTNTRSIINMFSFQSQWANGKFKQPADVGPSGIKDYTFDLRGLLGKDFHPTERLRTTAYSGFGYRYLKDDSQGLDPVIDGFTLLGYKRYSHYCYFPFGADILYQPAADYSWEGSLEYDYMFHGWQVSKLGVVPGYSTLVVDQGSGNGLRASLRFNMYFKYFDAFAEWFYRYWNIASSNSKPDPTDPSYSLNEPKNNTQEFGFKLGVQI